uniref:Uncharacterized protein n=1 Tax=Lepeophtheirus salmonis TaxID=72036 RepID=A0A0K2VFX7_LEPSM
MEENSLNMHIFEIDLFLNYNFFMI